LNIFFSLSLATSAPARFGATKGLQKISPLAMFQHRIAQITRGDKPRWQSRNFAFLFFNNFVQYVHRSTVNKRSQLYRMIATSYELLTTGSFYSSSSFTPCIRFVGQPARSQPFTNASRSPSITPCTLLVSTPVRKSFTMRYGWKT